MLLRTLANLFEIGRQIASCDALLRVGDLSLSDPSESGLEISILAALVGRSRLAATAPASVRSLIFRPDGPRGVLAAVDECRRRARSDYSVLPPDAERTFYRLWRESTRALSDVSRGSDVWSAIDRIRSTLPLVPAAFAGLSDQDAVRASFELGRATETLRSNAAILASGWPKDSAMRPQDLRRVLGAAGAAHAFERIYPGPLSASGALHALVFSPMIGTSILSCVDRAYLYLRVLNGRIEHSGRSEQIITAFRTDLQRRARVATYDAVRRCAKRISGFTDSMTNNILRMLDAGRGARCIGALVR